MGRATADSDPLQADLTCVAAFIIVCSCPLT